MEQLTVLREPGAFAGWPANYGLWRFGTELVAVVVVGHVAASDHLHARDMTRPFEPRQLRSGDGGRTWRTEPFPGDLRGARVLSADEHVVPALRAAGRLTGPLDPIPAPGVDFTTDVVLGARTGLTAGAESWFYRSREPGRWDGPYPLPGFGRAGVAARGDVVPLGRHEALWLLTSPDDAAGEGGTICAHTADGGRTFTLRSVVREEDGDGYAIMPASRRLPDGSVVTLLRRPSRLEAWRSDDEGHRWALVCPRVADTGRHGNPASLVTTSTGALVAVYGRRSEPYALAARTSSDRGETWSDEVTLADDIGLPDFGYPRTVDLGTDAFLTIYYRADEPAGDRWIAAVRWTVDDLTSATPRQRTA